VGEIDPFGIPLPEKGLTERSCCTHGLERENRRVYKPEMKRSDLAKERKEKSAGVVQKQTNPEGKRRVEGVFPSYLSGSKESESGQVDDCIGREGGRRWGCHCWGPAEKK